MRGWLCEIAWAGKPGFSVGFSGLSSWVVLDVIRMWQALPGTR